MFKPHVTVAGIVQAEGELLVVEERVKGVARRSPGSG
ncbi:NUDIX hydrolase|nr:NUDIX hydrolase [Candidatus Pantoea persica]